MAICDVLCQRAGIEDRFLGNDGDVATELFDVVGADVGAVEGYFARGGVVEAEEEGAYVSARVLLKREGGGLMVDFPPPEGPTMETFMPGSISKVRSLKIITLGLVGYENPTTSLNHVNPLSNTMFKFNYSPSIGDWFSDLH
jgi:hypothetical protein